MKVQISELKLGVKLITGEAFTDGRGAFMEVYSKEMFQAAGLPTEWAQDNVSYSNQGVLRGMHIQKVNPQGKLVRCLAGAICDYWVDLRPGSPTLGKWGTVTLKSDKSEAIYIPPGLAHGFFVPTSLAVVHYKCTTPYDKSSDGGIRWDDLKVGIPWPFEAEFIPLVSPKDVNLPTIDEYMETLG